MPATAIPETRSARPRTRLQAEQRKVYREKLLLAAQQVFADRTYSAVSVDDIATQAGVSRATFYRHFRSKLDIVAALTDRLATDLHPAHNVFLHSDVITIDVIDAWIRANIALYRDHAVLMRTVREAASIEPVFFRDHATANHERTIRKLAGTLPAFAVAASAQTREDAVRIRAHVLIRQLEMLCYDVAVTQWVDGLDVGCDMLSRQFMAFLMEHPGETRP